MIENSLKIPQKFWTSTVLAVHTRLCSMFPLAHSKLVFGLLSFKYHMGFLEHYRLIIRIMLHPSHKNSRLNENIIQFDWAYVFSMPILLILSSEELQPTCLHYFENNQLEHVIWTISTHMSSLYGLKSLLLDMIQQWFDSPQDTSPHSLISAWLNESIQGT